MKTMEVVPTSDLLGSLIVFVSDTAFDEKEQDELKLKLAQHGALVSTTINGRVSYMISEADDLDNIDLAQEHGLKIVSKDWITKCLKKEKLVPDNDFLIDDDDVIYFANKRKEKLEKNKRKWAKFDDEDEGVLKKSKIQKDQPKQLTSIDKECVALAKVATLYKDDKGVLWSKMEEKKDNTFFLAQILVSNSDQRAWVWTRWGPLNTPGQSKAKQFPSVKEAKKYAADIFELN
eukprot:TRINITY_DN7567_c0_g1_i1.p1 TRINITY_DN7567_c0_g1~~TRINITY_DN7567_c0_g1_i1.p1  ORF type:complete len:233 (+),score=64.77 TRINITY_DN7567_c0_g1_i1:1-699(+)